MVTMERAEAKSESRSATEGSTWDRPILAPGHNCWRIERAHRLSLLIDVKAYFDALAASLELAENSLLIVGWDIHTKTVLRPDGRGRGKELWTWIEQALERSPRLQVYLLEWDFSVLYVLERDWTPIWKSLPLFGHPRLHFRLDREQPWSASQHQKIVVLDGALAFVGGVDLTVNRWDTPEHKPLDPRRRLPSGEQYGPFHDVQVAVDGPAARALARIAEGRWQSATGERLPSQVGKPAWPEALAVDLADVDVAIARTLPARPGEEPVREVEQLYLDSIAAARTVIYVETQYFTATSLTEALARRLSEPDGPEVILVLPERCPGWLEQSTLGVLRRAQLAKLRQADRWGRLRAVAPFVGKEGARASVTVHAKVMILDDRLLRVGSSNLSNRSLGLDSECDIAVEARRPDDEVAKAIRSFRNRLLAEHLGLQEGDVDDLVERHGSFAALIDRAGTEERGVMTIDASAEDDALVLDAALVDPEGPEAPAEVAEHFLNEDVAGASRHPWVKATLAVAVLLALAAAWRWTPLNDWLRPESIVSTAEQLRASAFAPVVVTAVYVVGSLLMVPLTAMVMATALTFGFWEGTGYSLIGASLGGVAGFGVGRWLGRDTVHRLTGSRVRRVSELLGRRGLLSVIGIRLVPIAPYTIANLMLGASHVRLRDFVIGSALALLPGIIAINLFETNLHAAIADPSWGAILVALLVPIAAVLLLALLRRALHNVEKNDS